MLLRRKARANTPLKKIKRHVGTTQGGSAGQYLTAAAEPATEKMVKAFKTSWNTPDAQRIQEEGGVTLSIPREADGVTRQSQSPEGWRLRPAFPTVCSGSEELPTALSRVGATLVTHQTAFKVAESSFS